MNQKKNKVFYANTLSTNFKPHTFDYFNKFSFFNKKKREIYCKNFLLFIFLLKFKHLNKKSNVISINIFIKPQKKKVYTIIRSPYRHKLARQQFFIQRYFIKLNFVVILKKNINITNYNNLILLKNNLKIFNNFFETNVIYNFRKDLTFFFYFNDNFKLKNFLNY